MPLINAHAYVHAHAEISSKARVLNFGMCIHLYPYFVFASSKGSGKSVHVHILTKFLLITNVISIMCTGKYSEATFVTMWSAVAQLLLEGFERHRAINK